MTNEIKLNDIFRIPNPKDYKLHLGSKSEHEQHPLDYFAQDPKNWIGWNEWRGNRNDWTRNYIFSMIEFYPKSNSWLFAGVFKILNRLPDKYEIEEVADFAKYSGRLIVSFYRYQGLRGRAFYLEPYLNDFVVSELLPEIYTGEAFPGFDHINHDFSTLENIIRREKIDWKSALMNVKGVYLVSDKSNGKHYVGSAYGESGIWSRWQAYMGTGHGWNDQLVQLISKHGIDYARANFKIALLEIMSKTASDDYVIARESRWKEIVLSRKHGYNSN